MGYFTFDVALIWRNPMCYPLLILWYPLLIQRAYPGYALSVGSPAGLSRICVIRWLSVAYPGGYPWISLIPAYPKDGGFAFFLSGAGFCLSGLILAYPMFFNILLSITYSRGGRGDRTRRKIMEVMEQGELQNLLALRWRLRWRSR